MSATKKEITVIHSVTPLPAQRWNHEAFGLISVKGLRCRLSETGPRRSRGSRVIIVTTLATLRETISSGIGEEAHDVDRVVLDSSSGEEFADLLATIPPRFRGDLLLIQHDGGGLLSASSHWGTRRLDSLTPADVDFYLMANDLVAYDDRMDRKMA